MTKVFLATGNKKKIKEIAAIFEGTGIELLSILDGIDIPDVVEDGDTFEANSAKKALEIAKHLDMYAIADDSGLCVDALDGAPGVYSARYSGEDATDESNNKKLIADLTGIEDRSAKFVCVITLAKPSGEVHTFRGEVEGVIVDNPAGTDGFGYDPYFMVPEYNKTLAQIPEIKNKISHRAKALELLKKEIKDII